MSFLLTAKKGFFTPLVLIVILHGVAFHRVAAAPPTWWTTRGVLTSNAPSDYSLINQGQAKKLAIAAADYFEEALPGGAGAEVQNLANRLRDTKDKPDATDYRPVSIRQLKDLAKPFYDRLIALQTFTAIEDYPWKNPATSASDYSLANIGQAKTLFAFDDSVINDVDNDNDDLPDWWERVCFGTTELTGTSRARFDGTTLAEAFAQGKSLESLSGGNQPLLAVVSGGDQKGPPGEFADKPLIVRVNDGKTAIPITVSVLSGSVRLSTTKDSTASVPSLEVANSERGQSVATSNSSEAEIYLYAPVGSSGASTISISGTFGSTRAEITTTFVIAEEQPVPAKLGAMFWLRADAGVTLVEKDNQLAVVKWEDQIGKKVLVHANSGHAPLPVSGTNGINGWPAVLFPADKYWSHGLRSSGSIGLTGTEFTSAYVIEYKAPLATADFQNRMAFMFLSPNYGSNSSSNAIYFSGITKSRSQSPLSSFDRMNNVNYRAGNFGSIQTELLDADQTKVVGISTYDARDHSVYVNGKTSRVAVTQAPAAFDGNEKLVLFNLFMGGSTLKMEQSIALAEVILFNRRLSNENKIDGIGELDILKQYLETRYAIYGEDLDKDGLSNEEERNLKTDPRNRDTNGDGLDDAMSVYLGISPLGSASSLTTPPGYTATLNDLPITINLLIPDSVSN